MAQLEKKFLQLIGESQLSDLSIEVEEVEQ